MTLRLIKFNTFLGINKVWRVEKCYTLRFNGRYIIEQYANNKCYISWSESSRSDYEKNWQQFKLKNGISEDIEFLPLKTYSPDDDEI